MSIVSCAHTNCSKLNWIYINYLTSLNSHDQVILLCTTTVSIHNFSTDNNRNWNGWNTPNNKNNKMWSFLYARPEKIKFVFILSYSSQTDFRTQLELQLFVIEVIQIVKPIMMGITIHWISSNKHCVFLLDYSYRFIWNAFFSNIRLNYTIFTHSFLI